MQSLFKVSADAVDCACQLFGSSGHLTRPQNSTLRAYTACLPAGADENRHVKTIANTRYVQRPIDPHHFSYTARPPLWQQCTYL